MDKPRFRETVRCVQAKATSRPDLTVFSLMRRVDLPLLWNASRHSAFADSSLINSEAGQFLIAKESRLRAVEYYLIAPHKCHCAAKLPVRVTAEFVNPPGITVTELVKLPWPMALLNFPLPPVTA
jgi:hypothetical protein